MARVKGGYENALLDFLVSFDQFRPRILSQFFQLLLIEVNRVSQACKFKREQVCIGQTQNQLARGLRQGAAKDKIRIGKMCVSVKVIICRMVNTGIVFAAISDVQGGDADVIDERGVIRTRAESSDPQIGALPQFLAIVV